MIAIDWRHRSVCRDEDPELFFPVGASGPALDQIEQAKDVCRRCPVADECLKWALAAGEDHGVWGGLDEDERRTVNLGGLPAVRLLRERELDRELGLVKCRNGHRVNRHTAVLRTAVGRDPWLECKECQATHSREQDARDRARRAAARAAS